jgi:hypothetical protein
VLLLLLWCRPPIVAVVVVIPPAIVGFCNNAALNAYILIIIKRFSNFGVLNLFDTYERLRNLCLLYVRACIRVMTRIHLFLSFIFFSSFFRVYERANFAILMKQQERKNHAQKIKFFSSALLIRSLSLVIYILFNILKSGKTRTRTSRARNREREMTRKSSSSQKRS